MFLEHNEHAVRVGAGRLKATVEEYRKHLEAGLKWCAGGKHWTARGDFHRNWGNRDGLSPVCRACLQAQRLKYRADNHQRFLHESAGPARGEAV
jgi:hypothetical protein